MSICIIRGVQPLQYRGKPMWHFNGEDDASRCGRKGPNSATSLAKILSELYKGEEEEFLRIKPRDGFSMYNPRSWVSCYLLLHSIRSYLLEHNYLPHCLKTGTEEGRKRVQRPFSAARGSRPGSRPRTRRRSGHIHGIRRRDFLSGKQWRLFSGHHRGLSRTAPLVACK